MNTENFTATAARKLTRIGTLRNNWRQRLVEVYAHPTDETKVVAIGLPFAGGNPVVCVENRKDYGRAISLHPKTAIYE